MNKIKLFLILTILNISLFGSNLINIDNISKNLINDKKHTIVFFHMTYCGYCKQMIRETFNNKNIQNIINKDFKFVDVNINDREDIKYKSFSGSKSAFARELNIHFYPTILFIDKDNNIVLNIKGYRSKSKFKNILKYISTNSYKNMDYPTFLDKLEMDR